MSELEVRCSCSNTLSCCAGPQSTCRRYTHEQDISQELSQTIAYRSHGSPFSPVSVSQSCRTRCLGLRVVSIDLIQLTVVLPSSTQLVSPLDTLVDDVPMTI